MAHEPNPHLPQVVLCHMGLFIDGPLNVQVVSIDQPCSLRAVTQRVQKSCRAGELKSH